MGLGNFGAHTGEQGVSIDISPDIANIPQTNLQRVALLVVVMFAWALRLVSLSVQDIWWDEARNIDVALRPFTEVANAPELDIHPPVYFWILHGWAQLHGLTMGMDAPQMAFATRLLSVVACVVSVVLLYQLTWRAGPSSMARWTGITAALCGALSPFWLAESQETRMYTVGFALILGAAVTLLMAWRTRKTKVLLWFVLLSALALLTHYNAVFIFAAWYAGWLIWALLQPDRWRNVGILFACGFATLLLVLPVLPIAMRQIPVYANPNLTVPSIASYLSQNWQAYWGGYAFEPNLGNGLAPFWLWAGLALVVGGLLLAWFASTHKTPLAFLLLWIFGGLALYYVAVLDRGAFNVRYSSFITPALYALVAIALVAWSRLWKPLGAIAVVVALVLWPQAIYADLYDTRFAREDISGVTRWLREHAEPGAVIFVDQKYPFGFYYDRYTIDSGATPKGSEDVPARYLFVDINTIDKRLQEWAANASQVYWVQWFESDTDPRRAVPFLLDQAGERGGEENFQGYSIDWWQLSPPNTFVLAPNMTPVTIKFPPALKTVSISLPDGTVSQGDNLPVVIRWQREAGGTVTRPLKARVALYSADGARVSQRDERILNDRHLLPMEWTPEDQPLNVYLLDIPEDLDSGVYTIGLLVYDADTLEPLGMVDGAGNPAGVEATIGTVEVVGGASK